MMIKKGTHLRMPFYAFLKPRTCALILRMGQKLPQEE